MVSCISDKGRENKTPTHTMKKMIPSSARFFRIGGSPDFGKKGLPTHLRVYHLAVITKMTTPNTSVNVLGQISAHRCLARTMIKRRTTLGPARPL